MEKGARLVKKTYLVIFILGRLIMVSSFTVNKIGLMYGERARK